MSSPQDKSGQTPLKRALLAIEDLQARLDAAERRGREPIAVIGIGCRLPGGVDGPDAFWRLVREGVDVVTDVPRDRWDVDAVYDSDPEASGKLYTRKGGFLSSVDGFDPQFFGIAPREAVNMDPQQRLLLEVSWEALEHAAQAPDRLQGSRTGVFTGICSGDYQRLSPHSSDPREINAYSASGLAHSIASGRVAYVLGLQGPAISVDTACSSSLVATHLACSSLRAGECRMALAGGVHLMLAPDNTILFCKSRMMSPAGRCQTFGAGADGFVLGEGCAVVVLKRLADALADDDRILAVIRGTASNQDGASGGLTVPSGPAQEAVIGEAVTNGGLDPLDVTYVEAHGTGTSLGDPIEVRALAAALGDARPSDRPLLIGSVKANMGHLEAAAGITGLVKAILVVHHGEIPPHLHAETLSPHIPWDELPVVVARERAPWPAGRRRIAGVSSFGFSGTNAHVIVEEPPARGSPAVGPERPRHILAMSARSEQALQTLAASYSRHMDEHPDESPADVAYTANAGRAHLTHRRAIAFGSRDELRGSLRAMADGVEPSGTQSGTLETGDRPRVVFMFTGQGAQYVGMGRVLYETQPTYRETIERCQEILSTELDRSLTSLLFDEGAPLDQTGYTQPALFALEYSLAELWRSWGLQPAAVLGHSVGEYVAACRAGVFSLEDGLRLIAARGRLMQSLPAGGAMAAVMTDEQRVEGALARFAGRLSIAAVNAPTNVVISGPEEDVRALCGVLGDEGIKTTRLSVSHAFHSPLMQPIRDEFERVARGISYATPKLPLISNLTGQAMRAGEVPDAAYWSRHLREPVRFKQSLQWLHQKGYRTFVEIGPTPTLSGLGQQCVDDANAAWLPSLRKGRDDWETLITSLGALYVRGARLDWRGFERGYARRMLTLPTYPFERVRHWFAGTGRPRSRAGASPATDHALLGARVRSAVLDDVVFEREMSASDPAFVADHRVHDLVVFPATAYVDLALAAGAAVAGNGDSLALHDLTIHEALAFRGDETRVVQTVVSPGGDGARGFRVFSAPTDSEGWRLHAAGQIVRSRSATEPAGEALDAVRARCLENVEAGEFYGRLEARGLGLGTLFQGVAELWRGKGEALARVAAPASMTANGNSIHPVHLDACLQALAGALLDDGDPGAAPVFMPLAIRDVHIARGAARAVWSHARVPDARVDGETLTGEVRAYDGDGRLVVSLEGISLKRADPAALRQAIAAGADGVAELLYQVEWRAQPLDDVSGSRVASSLPHPAPLLAGMEARCSALIQEHGFDEYAELEPNLDAVVAAYVVEALSRLGWTWRPGERRSAGNLAEALGVAPRHGRALGRLLEILGEQGLVRRERDAWEVVGAPVSSADTACAELESRYSAFGAELTLTRRFGPELAAVLRGEADPLHILFPDGSFDAAEQLYLHSPGARAYNQLAGEILESALAQAEASRRVRILEIGGGTGGTTAALLPLLPSDRTEYVFTDISALFASRAQERFRAFPFLRAQALDIEQDPRSQGFADQRFDVIVAANVIHATRDLRQTLAHVSELLAPGGLLAMIEVTRPQAWVDMTFGLTDGWWRFEDPDVRPAYPLLSRAQWGHLLTTGMGFVDAAAIPGDQTTRSEPVQAIVLARAPLAPRAERVATQRVGPDWLLLGDERGLGERLAERLRSEGDTAVVVRAGAAAAASAPRAVEAARDVLTSAREAFGSPRNVVHLWSLDASPARRTTPDTLRSDAEHGAGSLLGAVQVLAAASPAEPPRLWVVTRGAQPVDGCAPSLSQSLLGGMTKSVALEHPELRCTRIDLAPGGQAGELAALAAELRGNQNEEQVALRPEGRLVARLTRARLATGAADAEPWEVDIGERGMLDNLVLRPASRREPARGEVEIEVRATGLNFRDVLNAMGLYPGAPPPFGSECAGRVVGVGEGVVGLSVGDDVIAMVPGCLRSHVVADATFVVPKPQELSYDEAAGIAIPFVTAWFCLVHVAELDAGERVLIHSAAGGVGLAAVQVALSRGAEVFATASTPAKREHLLSKGVQHVMDSRSLEFADEILALTNGAGVDVVLNSLSGDSIERSFAATAPKARFVEIGKRGIWDSDRVASVRPGVTYTVVDWGETARRDPRLIRGVLEQVLSGFEEDVFEPLPRRVFAVSDTVAAFRHMAGGRHTGKIVLRAPASLSAPSVRADGTYLVTGGLGGLGLLTAAWLVDRGARHLVLTGRSAASAEAEEAIGRMRGSGAEVRVEVADVADEDRMREVFAALRTKSPPLRGVVHSAGTLDDGVLTQVDWPRFAKVLAPKVVGSWLLHELTRDASLDFFVEYSSVASLLGSPGQANHASANAFLDALAHHRRSQGLPAASLQWGPWSEVGAAARLQSGERAAVRGVAEISPQTGLEVLGRLLDPSMPVVGVVSVDWGRFLEGYRPGEEPRFFGAVPRPSAGQGRSDAPRQATLDLKARLAKASPGSREEILRVHVREQALKVLGLEPGFTLDPKRPLQEMGLDSLMAVELRNALGSSLGQTLPATLLFDYPTVEAIFHYLATDVLGLRATVGVEATPRPGGVVDAIEELSDEDVDRLLADKMGRAGK